MTTEHYRQTISRLFSEHIRLMPLTDEPDSLWRVLPESKAAFINAVLSLTSTVPNAEQRLDEDMYLFHNARAGAFEEAARHVETTGLRNHDNIARDIRALAVTSTKCDHPRKAGGGSVGEDSWSSYWTCQDCGASDSQGSAPALTRPSGDGK